MVALVQHQAVHTFKLPVLDLGTPQGRKQHRVLGPADVNVVGKQKKGSHRVIQTTEARL